MSVNSWNKKRVLAIVVVAVLAAVVAAQAYELIGGQARTAGSTGGTTNTGTDTRTITVQGTGSAQIPPDRAILTIGVVTNGVTASAAVQSNANTMNAVISALNAIGIDNSSIQTEYYYISPQYSCCTPPYTLTGYQVTNDIQVTVNGSGQPLAWLGAKAGQVIDTVTSNGATEVNGIQFTASGSELEQTHQTALSQAAQNAALDAHTLAATLNVTITGVVSVTPTPTFTPGPIFVGTTSVSTSTPVVPPQSLTVTATVQVVFSIN